MPVELRMPRLGEGVIEATVSQWLKQEGDPVEEMEPIVVVSTDKVDTEIPAPASGILQTILVPEGKTVPVDTVLALIAVTEEGKEQPEDTASSPERAKEPTPQVEGVAPSPIIEPTNGQTQRQAEPPRYRPGRHPELGYISPLVARLANEHGIDLRQVKGTGKGGRITKKDVLAYLETIKAQPAPQISPQPAPAPEMAPVPEVQMPTPSPQVQEVKTTPVQPKTVPPLPGDELIPLTNMRRRIAEHMVYSKFTAPHVTTVMEADMSRVLAHREAHKDAFAAKGVRLTLTAYFVYAAVQALKAFPLVNASWSDEGIIRHRMINIGVAVGLDEEGLIVPVIKHADEYTLLGLARQINDLARRAREKQLRPDDIAGSTFSITNHGVYGSLFATPIINHPNAAILGVGAVKKRVVVIDDAIAIRPMVYLSLTFDHRILDGAVADRFLAHIVNTLEQWPVESAR